MQIFTIADKYNRLVSQSKSASQKGFTILGGHCWRKFEWARQNADRYPKFGLKSEFIEKHRQYSIMIIFTVTHVTVISAGLFFTFVLCLLLLLTSRVQICVRRWICLLNEMRQFGVWTDKWNVTFHYCPTVKMIRICMFGSYRMRLFKFLIRWLYSKSLIDWNVIKKKIYYHICEQKILL